MQRQECAAQSGVCACVCADIFSNVCACLNEISALHFSRHGPMSTASRQRPSWATTSSFRHSYRRSHSLKHKHHCIHSHKTFTHTHTHIRSSVHCGWATWSGRIRSLVLPETGAQQRVVPVYQTHIRTALYILIFSFRQCKLPWMFVH